MMAARTLLPLLLSLGLMACGTMAEFDPPATPPAPQQPAEPPAPPEEVVQQPTTAAEFEDTDASALSDFKEPLDPYGTWVDEPTYGYVWVPSKSYVSEDFAPYVTAGHWATDSNGDWLWVSDYDDSFGWVVFHYGRWVWVSGHGWVWIPGRRYAPAWVVWRTGDPGYDYIGWAPAPPGYYWRSGVVVWLDVYPPAPYVFCPTTHVFHHHVHTHIVARERVPAVAAKTRPYGSMPPPSSRHVMATPSRGPTATSGHIPGQAWPKDAYAAKASKSHYATPQGMGRSQLAPRVQPQPGSHPFSPAHPQQPQRAPGHAPGDPTPHRSAPPPQRSAPAPQRAVPAPQQRAAPAPPPQRAAPAPPPQRAAPAPAPPPQRAAPAPKPAPAPAPAPARSSKPSGGGRGKK